MTKEKSNEYHLETIRSFTKHRHTSLVSIPKISRVKIKNARDGKMKPSKSLLAEPQLVGIIDVVKAGCKASHVMRKREFASLER
jgi:hypothetical protein